ncbi:MAG TPA: thiamine-phosphate kinase [Alphaproteobacteria bacterium]
MPGNAAGRPRPGEFELIARLFAPLAARFPDACGLEDDVAYLRLAGGLLAPGEELVVKTDALIASVHFLPADPADLIARKLMRVNLSDLAAKGARPLVYTLALMLPDSVDFAWLERFAEGLKHDQEEFGFVLVGGDTDRTPGPLSLSLTAIGAIPAGERLLRSAAKVGDAIFVSGTIGDGALGLKAIRGELAGLSSTDSAYLADRYHLPQPRLALGARLRGIAHAAMDISDGLLGDLQHICDASHLGAIVESARIPLSQAGQAVTWMDAALMESVLTGGDDYEILFTAEPSREAALVALGRELGTPITRIGAMEEGKAVRVIDHEGREMAFAQPGYRHF